MSEDAKPHLSVMLPEVLAALDAKSGDRSRGDWSGP